ncbi:alpha/beta hydrolase [Actinotalea sp. JY-7885]|nr:alpha/beta hydrolase [Actinotalea sp. JY-7885]
MRRDAEVPEIYPLTIPHVAASDQQLAAAEERLGHALDPLHRQLLTFANGRSQMFVHTDLHSAGELGGRGIWSLLGGTGTNETKMPGQYDRAMTFVEAAEPRGSLAVITYLGGPMPQSITADAPHSHYALDQAGALRDFVAGVERPEGVPLTVVGHSYGGSVVGAAEAAGMVADRILHVESAGAGPNVFNVQDNADPSTPRYSMTAPGDAIGATQGLQAGPFGHGADPDLLDGVVRLETGRIDADDPNSGIVQGLASHSAVFNRGTTAWENVLAVMTGGEATMYTEPDMHMSAGRHPVAVPHYPMSDPDFVPPTVQVQ